MVEANDLDCRIYVDTDAALDELASGIAQAVSGVVEGTRWTKVISVPPGEINILERV